MRDDEAEQLNYDETCKKYNVEITKEVDCISASVWEDAVLWYNNNSILEIDSTLSQSKIEFETEILIFNLNQSVWL